MKYTLTDAELKSLSSNKEGTFLSLYQTTHRNHPDNQQDPVVFRNLLKVLESSLLKTHSAAEAQVQLKSFHELAEDRDFWNHTLDGLAVLGCPNCFKVYKLQRPVPELAIVADSFHTKPLRQYLQSADRFQVLGISRSRIQLFEGNRDTLEELDPGPKVPQSITAALGDELTEPRHTVAAYGGAGGSQGAMHHGHGGKKDQVDLDAERFFRIVDRAVLEHFSRPSGLPLLLATLPEHQALFRKISHNPFLMEAGLNLNPEGLTLAALRQKAWALVEPLHQARQENMAVAFSHAWNAGLASDDIVQVAEAAACGRVSRILIESGRVIPGRLQDATGVIEAADPDDPEVDDLLDDLGQLVVKMGGEVWVMPARFMPGSSGLAATYRH
jgi:hypothetical protein